MTVGADRMSTIAEITGETGIGLKTIVEKRKLARDYMCSARNERETADKFALGEPRYIGGGFYSTRTRWTNGEKEALAFFVKSGAKPEDAAIALGRSPSSIIAYAKEAHIHLRGAAVEWRGEAGLAAFKRKIARDALRAESARAHIRELEERRQERAEMAALQFPYIRKTRDEHTELLEVNDLIPKGIPSHMRADIVQDIMLALLEGNVTMEVLRAKRSESRWFVTKFYKDNFEQAGHALSLTQNGADGDEYNLLDSRFSHDEWHVNQTNEKRRSFEAITHTFYAPTQVEDTYFSQIRNEQRRLHEDGSMWNIDESEAALTALDPKLLRHRDFEYKSHAALRLKERYGITATPTIWQEMTRAVKEGRVHVTRKREERNEDDDGIHDGWIRLSGRNVLIRFNASTRQFLTVLTPEGYSDDAR